VGIDAAVLSVQGTNRCIADEVQANGEAT